MKRTFENGSSIEASNLHIGTNITVGKDVSIKVRGDLHIGNHCHLGDGVSIACNYLEIGDHFYHLTPGLVIGGGGSHTDESDMIIGDRCVMHNNYINVARTVHIKDDVGLSPDVQILTHGFWGSALEGFPVDYAGVTIDENVIIGQRSMVLPGVRIAKNTVIGAQSTVTKSITMSGVYVGTPARFVRNIPRPSFEEQQKVAHNICMAYWGEITYFDYPIVEIGGAMINLKSKTLRGSENQLTDDFRDHLRRYGIKIYTDRKFGLAKA